MTNEEYLHNVLKNHKLDTNSPEIEQLRAERKKIEEIIKNKFSDAPPTIRYGGSKMKDTMIRDSYDLDIICYFDSDKDVAGDNLAEIYDNVKSTLSSSYYVAPKKSALRLQSIDVAHNDFHIDVVPGRYVDNTKGDCYLYQAEGEKERLKTNLDVHIGHIKNSGLTDLIALLKVWKTRSGLELKTFILELLVVKYVNKNELDSNQPLMSGLNEFWSYVVNHDVLVVEDPANQSGNDLSSIFTDSDKILLKSAARHALQLMTDNVEYIFGSVDTTTDEDKRTLLEKEKVNYTNAPRPYCLQKQIIQPRFD